MKGGVEREKRKQTREGDLLYISTYRGIALSLSLLSFSFFFPVSFFSLFRAIFATCTPGKS